MIKLPPLVALVVAIALPAEAHRLDECLQATRLAVRTNRVDLSIDVTPGVAIADQFRSIVDSDQDGRFSTGETETYALRVLEKSPVELDGRPLKVELMEVTFPSTREMKTGQGVIRIRAMAMFATLSAGPHQLHLRNNHLPNISIYLVNAMKPDDGAIEIRRQSRNWYQTQYGLEFEVLPSAGPNEYSLPQDGEAP